MKKFVTTILAVLYLATSTGATVHMHYCMGQLADWDLGHSNSKTCGGCGMEKTDAGDNGCCKDEHKFVKDDTAQKVTNSNILLVHAMSTTLPSVFFNLTDISISSVTEENQISHAPPRTIGVAVYIRNCVFRI